jgi:hypothetical protein
MFPYDGDLRATLVVELADRRSVGLNTCAFMTVLCEYICVTYSHMIICN